MEAEFEATEDFHHAWKMKARDVLAKAEWRRRKLNKRVRAMMQAMPGLVPGLVRPADASCLPKAGQMSSHIQQMLHHCTPTALCHSLTSSLSFWLISSGSQMKEEQLRLEEDEASAKKRLKETREHHKHWEESREGRVRV